MLTDIFSIRYANNQIWNSFGEQERRLVIQSFRILTEQICPYWVDGKATDYSKSFWSELHGRVSMELGLKSLSALAYSYQSTSNGQPHTVTGMWTIDQVCENWMFKVYDTTLSADQFLKDRLSLIELGFRLRGEKLRPKRSPLKDSKSRKNLKNDKANAQLTEFLKSLDIVNEERDEKVRLQSLKNFDDSVDELNTRFRQANCNLNYHNGFIQVSTDSLLEAELERPFWVATVDQKWANVDYDMKQAIDLRDNNGRDPAFYAARALESALKIVSDEKGWTHGSERGAHSYIDNLAAKKVAFIADWESRSLKSFFSEVRNPLGHGPGKDPIHTLNYQQTNWAIETCMTWIKSLILRM